MILSLYYDIHDAELRGVVVTADIPIVFILLFSGLNLNWSNIGLHDSKCLAVMSL